MKRETELLRSTITRNLTDPRAGVYLNLMMRQTQILRRNRGYDRISSHRFDRVTVKRRRLRRSPRTKYFFFIIIPRGLGMR